MKLPGALFQLFNVTAPSLFALVNIVLITCSFEMNICFICCKLKSIKRTKIQLLCTFLLKKMDESPEISETLDLPICFHVKY
jgi:hypothetical protein